MSWSIRPSRFFRDEVEKKHAEIVQAIALEFWTRVTLRTPVDTGRARANWSLTAVPDDSTTTSIIQQPPSTNPELYPVYYVQNTLPYIVALEFGSSSQAPNGMFRLTLAEFTS